MNPRAVAAAMPACSLYPLQGSLMLLDAHLVFQPFLAALGVSPHQVTQGMCFIMHTYPVFSVNLSNINPISSPEIENSNLL